ncbi:hypothetical protein FIBSPDRAFT_876758, partial [Athelia psychrophila]
KGTQRWYIHAGHVEDTLLGQMRGAEMGQEIDVWVLGRTRVRFRVGAFPLSLFPLPSTMNITESLRDWAV